MAQSYNRLWKLLIDKKMSISDLRKVAVIAPNTMTRMRKDQDVSMSVLGRICDVLDCDYGDIVEHITNKTIQHQKTMNKRGF